jgi:hypothetical protein
VIGSARVTRISILLVVLLAAACSNDSHKAKPSRPTNHARPAPSEFAIVLDDTGLHVPLEARPAATYTLSFTDRRSQRRVNQHVALGLSPSGPDIVLLSLPAGARRNVVLLANLCARVMINGVRQRDLAECLNIETSKQYPTPAT